MGEVVTHSVVNHNAGASEVLVGIGFTITTVARVWPLSEPGLCEDVTDVANVIMVLERYLSWEFPSLVSSNPNDRIDSVIDSIERIFVVDVGKIEGVEQIFVRKDQDYFRIWTVINEPDVEIEDKIYEVQLTFIDRFKIPCDFSVIFRQGRSLDSINLPSARRIYP